MIYEVAYRHEVDDELEVVRLWYPAPHNCFRVEIWGYAEDMTSEQAVALGRALITAAGQTP